MEVKTKKNWSTRRLAKRAKGTNTRGALAVTLEPRVGKLRSRKKRVEVREDKRVK